MNSLQNKQILLGITGGIAAYKSAELVRRLRDQGASVRVVMTAAAQEFITPLTLQALSGNPVHTSLLDTEAEAAMGHIELARWADLILIAPVTANFMAQLTAGNSADLLSAICLATSARIAIAPAMNQGMWNNPATQDNLALLKSRQMTILGPAEGSQACGETGPGRMLEPDNIVVECDKLFQTGALAGKKVVITAGPTQEAIDPVRYISNHSSGKMGYAIAQAAQEAGATTVLIAGPVNIPAPMHVQVKHVTTANEMLNASLEQLTDCDLFIAAAAVADYRPIQKETHKIKKGSADSISIELIKNPDIVATVAQQHPRPYIVGFAAETNNVVEYAKRKLEQKNLDLVVANDVSQPDIGFNSENNEVTLVWPDGNQPLEQQSKRELARDLIKRITERMTVK